MATRKADQAAPAAPAAPHHSIEIGAEDVALPRMRICQDLSDHVKARRFEVGDIVVGIESDDAEAVKVGDAKTGVRFHVLAMTSHLEGKDETDNFTRWEHGDPEAPIKARTAYEFTLCVPEYDEMLPVKFTFGGSAARVAKGINSALVRHQAAGPPWDISFVMTTAMKQRDRYTWAAPVVTAALPEPKLAAIAASMGESLTAAPQQQIEAGEDSF